MSVLKLNEYYEFVRWIALPEPVRRPPTQKLLAEDLGVRPETLSDWKNDPNFYEDVRHEIERWAKEKTPNVVAGLYRKAVRDGDAAAVKLWYQIFEGFSEKTKVENTNVERKEIIVSVEQKNLIVNAFANFGLIKQKEDNEQPNTNIAAGGGNSEQSGVTV